MSTGKFFIFCPNLCGRRFDSRQQHVAISDVMHLRALSVGKVIFRVIYVDIQQSDLYHLSTTLI